MLQKCGKCGAFVTRARTGKGKKKNRWLRVTGSPGTEMIRAAPKAKPLMVGDEYTTMSISFLMGGYYLIPEVLLVFVLCRRLMDRRYTVISHLMHIL